MSFACEICHQDPGRHGITVYRINKTGVPGIWRCKEHLPHRREPDEEEIVTAIEDCLREMHSRPAEEE